MHGENLAKRYIQLVVIYSLTGELKDTFNSIQGREI